MICDMAWFPQSHTCQYLSRSWRHNRLDLIFKFLFLHTLAETTSRCTMALTTASQHHSPLPINHVHRPWKFGDVNPSMKALVSSFRRELVGNIGIVRCQKKLRNRTPSSMDIIILLRPFSIPSHYSAVDTTTIVHLPSSITTRCRCLHQQGLAHDKLAIILPGINNFRTKLLALDGCMSSKATLQPPKPITQQSTMQ